MHIVSARLGQAGTGHNEVKVIWKHAMEWRGVDEVRNVHTGRYKLL